MLAYIKAAWLALKGAAALSGLVTWKKNRDLMKAGAAEERDKFNKESRDVEKRMDDTDRADSGSVADSLRDGKF